MHSRLETRPGQGCLEANPTRRRNSGCFGSRLRASPGMGRAALEGTPRPTAQEEVEAQCWDGCPQTGHLSTPSVLASAAQTPVACPLGCQAESLTSEHWKCWPPGNVTCSLNKHQLSPLLRQAPRVWKERRRLEAGGPRWRELGGALPWQSRAGDGGRGARGAVRKGTPEVTGTGKHPGATSGLAGLECRGRSGCWRLPEHRVGSWHTRRFFWSCWLQAPRGGTSLGSWLTVCFLGNLYHLRALCSEIAGCRADISTPPSCSSPPCFISMQHRRGWCLASRGAQGAGLAFSWGTFERLLAEPRMHMGGGLLGPLEKLQSRREESSRN